MNTLDFIQKQSKPVIFLLTIIQIILIAFIDYIVGKEISVRLLYLIPISMVAWSTGLKWGLVFAFASAASKIFIDIILGISYSHNIIFAWEGLIVFGIFAAYVVILSKLRTALYTLRKKNKALKKANEIKNEFMIMAAHDLKNPLSNILGFASLIKEDKNLNNDEVDEISGRIVNISERMFKLIDNLLGYNQNVSDKINVDPEIFDICSAVENVIKQFDETAKSKSILLHFKKETDSIFVIADFELTLQVLDNLISNAIKFSPHGKNVFVEIYRSKPVKKKNDKSRINIKVIDEGPGFTEADKRNLFKKFSKLSAKPTAGESSTGMGLYIVKRFVEAMGGKISCESIQNNGASFIIDLPEGKQ